MKESAARIASQIVRPLGSFHFDLHHTREIGVMCQVFPPSFARDFLSRGVTSDETSSDKRQRKENNVEHGHGTEDEQRGSGKGY
jgi:hypothetical protein